MFGKKGIFGTKQPQPATRELPQPQPDSDGRRRIFGEEVYAKHGDFLRAMGRDINDPENILPNEEDHQRKVQESLDRQELRRQKIEANLLQRHGVNAIRPFFVLAEPVMNSQLGLWLMRVMDLQPYEDWNLVYLPTDAATASAMDLPLHPGCSIKPIDELMVERIGELYGKFEEGRQKINAIVLGGGENQFEAMDRFSAFRNTIRQAVIDHVETIKPKIVELIADVQSRS